MIGRSVKGRLSIFVVVIMLLVTIGPAAYAAKPGNNTGVDITTSDFSVTLTQGESYQFEVVARYGSSKTLTWEDSLDNLAMISSKSVGIQEKVIYQYSAGTSTEEATITVSDGSSSDSLIATFIVEVGTPENHPPTVEDLFLTTDEDNSVTGTLKATDLDGDTLTAQISSDPSIGSAMVLGLEVTYTPDADKFGSDSFEVTVSDGSGGSDSAIVNVTIISIDDPPVAVDDSASTNMNIPVDIFVMANDTDIDNGEMNIIDVTSPSDGSATNNTSYITYKPNSDFVGTDYFEYTLNGGSNATVTITVIGESNQPPIVENLSLTTDEDISVEGTLIASDIEGDPLTTEITRIPSNGMASINGLGVVYTPYENYNGNDSFEVTVSDGNGGSATATVSIKISPVDDPPVAVADSASTDMNTPVYIYVMDNDTDIDAGAMYIESVSDESNGIALIIDEDNDGKGDLVRFTPTDGYFGDAGFTYTLNGGSFATVRVTVSELIVEPVKYVALGDSIPYGTYYTSFWNYLFDGTDSYSYVEQFADYLNVDGGNFTDASVSGHNTVDVFYQINQMSDTISSADIITLCVGANDIMDAASRGWSGLNKYDIDWNVAVQGRDNFEIYWPKVIDSIETLNPDVTLIVMTIYNPYRTSDDYFNLVDPYFSSGTGDLGLNYIIENTMSIDNNDWGDMISDDFDYKVVDIYGAFNSYSNKDSLTGFYSSFCDPHPNQLGQDLIFSKHKALY